MNLYLLLVNSFSFLIFLHISCHSIGFTFGQEIVKLHIMCLHLHQIFSILSQNWKHIMGKKKYFFPISPKQFIILQILKYYQHFNSRRKACLNYCRLLIKILKTSWEASGWWMSCLEWRFEKEISSFNSEFEFDFSEIIKALLPLIFLIEDQIQFWFFNHKAKK